jgi:hypothetical protein
MDTSKVHHVEPEGNVSFRQRRPSFFRPFVGLAFVFVGILYLLQNLGFLQGVDIGMVVGKIWPVLIIFFGLAIVSRSGRAAYVVSMLIALAIAGLIIYLLLYPSRYHVSQNLFPGTSMDSGTYRSTNNQ